MSANYKLIKSEFIQAYHANPSQFQHFVKIAFNKAKEIDDKYGINIMFIHILEVDEIEWTAAQIKYMIDLGADPRFRVDRALFLVGGYSTSDAAKYLIENHNLMIDSNAIGEIFYYTEKASLDTLRLFLDKGNSIEDRHIESLVCRSTIAEVLIEKGYNIGMVLRGIIGNKRRYDDKKNMYQFIMNQIKKEDLGLDKDLVNKLFESAIGCGQVTMDDVTIFINAGMDPRYDNDIFFAELCRFGSEIPLYFINEYGADVNAHDGLALNNAIRANSSTIKFLLESDIIVTDDHILEALYYPDTMEMLVGHGDITEERISKVLAKKLFDKFTTPPAFLDAAKTYIRKGIDFNQIILGLTIDDKRKFEEY